MEKFAISYTLSQSRNSFFFFFFGDKPRISVLDTGQAEKDTLHSSTPLLFALHACSTLYSAWLDSLSQLLGGFYMGSDIQ